MFFYSYTILWIIIIILSLSVLILFKKLAPPKPSLDMEELGLDKGMKTPITNLNGLKKENVNLLEPKKIGTVLIYLSVNCGACANVLRDISNYVTDHTNLSVVIFMKGENEREIINKVGDLNNQIPIIFLTEEHIGLFKISLFPFAYFLSSKGVVLAKGGVPAGRRHLELLTHLAMSGNRSI
ncbi:hypothetical protein NSQ43_13000 [Sporosarcina sp. FSL W8-0480]|uniref:hypothetical protein n=1 Tax=Sporosarcina sp. FSL W8-0480 TaxID=2954701 RepID=UPI0030DAB810